MEDWEINLRDGFSQFGMNNLESMNKGLYDWTKNWISVLNTIEGVGIAKLSRNHIENYIDIEVKMKGSDLQFKAHVIFTMVDKDVTLNISNICKYDFVSRNFSPDFEPQWEEENLIGIEIREKGFVLQLLNNRILEYLQWFMIRNEHFENQRMED